MIILAIDAATVTSGFAIIKVDGPDIKLVDWGRIKAKGALHERLEYLRTEVVRLLEEHEPDEVAVEDLKFSKFAKNFSSLGKVAMAIGVVQAAFAGAGHKELYSVPANVVRKTWDVKQDKSQLRAAVNKKFIKQIKDNGRPDGFIKADEDTVDAIGLAVTTWTLIAKEKRNG